MLRLSAWEAGVNRNREKQLKRQSGTRSGTLPFAFLSHRKTEISQLSAQGIISAVRESGEMCAFQAELTVAVNQAFLYSDSNNIRKEHIMRSERNDLCHPALQ